MCSLWFHLPTLISSISGGMQSNVYVRVSERPPRETKPAMQSGGQRVRACSPAPGSPPAPPPPPAPVLVASPVASPVSSDWLAAWPPSKDQLQLQEPPHPQLAPHIPSLIPSHTSNYSHLGTGHPLGHHLGVPNGAKWCRGEAGGLGILQWRGTLGHSEWNFGPAAISLIEARLRSMSGQQHTSNRPAARSSHLHGRRPPPRLSGKPGASASASAAGTSVLGAAAAAAAATAAGSGMRRAGSAPLRPKRLALVQPSSSSSAGGTAPSTRPPQCDPLHRRRSPALSTRGSSTSGLWLCGSFGSGRQPPPHARPHPHPHPHHHPAHLNPAHLNPHLHPHPHPSTPTMSLSRALPTRPPPPLACCISASSTSPALSYPLALPAPKLSHDRSNAAPAAVPAMSSATIAPPRGTSATPSAVASHRQPPSRLVKAASPMEQGQQLRQQSRDVSFEKLIWALYP